MIKHALITLALSGTAALACGPDYTMLDEHVGNWCQISNSDLLRLQKNCPADRLTKIDLGGYNHLNGRCAVVTTHQEGRRLLVDFLCRDKFKISAWFERKGNLLEIGGSLGRACEKVTEGCEHQHGSAQ